MSDDEIPVGDEQEAGTVPIVNYHRLKTVAFRKS